MQLHRRRGATQDPQRQAHCPAKRETSCAAHDTACRHYKLHSGAAADGQRQIGLGYGLLLSLPGAARGCLPLAALGGQVELLEPPKLLAQLVGLERRTSRAGKDSIDHGIDGHDDVANCVAGAVYEAGDAPPPLVLY